MTNFAGWLFPLPELFPQVLTTSLDDGLERWDGFGLVDLLELVARTGTRTHVGTPTHQTHDRVGHRMPSYADDLFGHILIIPPRLDVGNLLTTQTRVVEIANLDYRDRDWNDATNNAGDGITLETDPSLPQTIEPFGNRYLSVVFSTEGPATIDGTIDLEFDGPELIPIPVTGSRIVMFEFIPQADVMEVIEWATDVLEAYDDSEQRASIRLAPRQRLRYTVATIGTTDMRMRAILFDWLPRIFGVPIWWEERALAAPALQGGFVLNVATEFGDFREGGLVMVALASLIGEAMLQVHTFDVFEIESFDLDQITLASEIPRNYPAGAFVVPVRTAYAQTMTSAGRMHDGLTKTQVEFVTRDNEDLADQAGATIYDSRVVLDDGNVVTDTLPESFSRQVVVLDNESGRVVQVAHTDRSRITSRFAWDAPTAQELWRVRCLLHSFYGSQKAFWVPSCRFDFELSTTIGASAAFFRILFVGYTAFIRSRRPLGDVQFRLTNGTVIRRRILSSVVDGEEEVITVNSAISGTAIPVAQVARVELLTLSRISDDVATIEHARVGDARITINTISTKD